jgi:hypothetical protein
MTARLLEGLGRLSKTPFAGGPSRWGAALSECAGCVQAPSEAGGCQVAGCAGTTATPGDLVGPSPKMSAGETLGALVRE